MEIETFLDLESSAIVGYSLGNEQQELAITIARMIGKNRPVYIVSDKIREGVLEAVRILKYSDQVANLRSATLVFDDIDETLEKIGVLGLQKMMASENKVAVLANFLSSAESIEQFQEIFPRTAFLKAIFSEGSDNITFKAHMTSMTDYQKLYHHITKDDRYENIAFPIEEKGIEVKNINSIPGEHILKYSPKIKNLLNMITGDHKHVVYTIYKKHGLQVLRMVGKLYNIPIFTDVNKFNQSPVGVLVITPETYQEIKEIAPREVKHIHMLDGDLKSVDKILKTIYKYSNYQGSPSKLDIHYHLGNQENLNEYRMEQKRLSSRIGNWRNQQKTRLGIYEDGIKSLTPIIP